jgi:glucose-6-phosphate isomerase
MNEASRSPGATGPHKPPTDSRPAWERAWAAVTAQADACQALRIDTLFESEPDRLDRLSIEAAGLWLDLSRNRLPAGGLAALLALAEAADVPGWRDAMFTGYPINGTEARAALHVALRCPPDPLPRQRPPDAGHESAATEIDPLTVPLSIAGENVRATVGQALARMRSFAEAVRDGSWLGATGRPITDIVNVGIGGSQLGPELACQALAGHAHPRLRAHFLSNVDPTDWQQLAARLDPASTLVIVASKSWRTRETAMNAAAVRDWLLAGGVPEGDLHRHLAGVTSNVDGAKAFGVRDASLFPFGDWVGGRYSLWSAIGLPVMLLVGPAAFDQLLAGAHAMDRLFADAPLARNAPVLLALVSLWNSLVHPGCTEVVTPYSSRLARLPAWLQQLQMESNGKQVDRHGRQVGYDTAPACWGEPGTGAQHSFFQALHQGTRVHPIDFVVPAPDAWRLGGPAPRSPAGPAEDPPGCEYARATTLLANAVAQAEALMYGRAAQAGDPLGQHRACPGNRPSNTILISALTPASLGALLALYEHKTVTLGWLWRIDSFDQWGVELGKTLASAIEPLLATGQPAATAADDRLSPSARATLARLHGLRGRDPQAGQGCQDVPVSP